ncbi:MAG: hypothetical protein JSW19_03795 [Candidatus Bathyarchaeota archaeon]|nr:MAG: hypothetical protein JSW19_03795 [Candidatus Bathyarchaeota archaeon]
MEAEQVWPYVLPFPLEHEKRKLIWTILQSKVGMSILTKLKVRNRTYQQDLIQETPYSNKSIIEYLKRMVSAGILENGMEQILTDNRRVWVRWYSPTKLGRWFILFLRPPGEISSALARKTVEELFQVYSSSIAKVCEKYGIDLDSFHRILNAQHLKKTSGSTKKEA